MRTIMIYKGLPGSGKSTEAAKLVAKEPTRWVRINRDDLRGMVVGPGNNPFATGNRNDREELMRSFKNELTLKALKDGYDVILDDTHLVPMTVKKLHQLAASVGDVKVIERGVNVSVEECIKRDAAREGFKKVGEKVITDMARGAGLEKGRKLSDKETYYAPRWTAGAPGGDHVYGYDPESELPKAVICDLDGTLALMNGRSPYDATNCDQDLPNWPVIECVKAMYQQGFQILFTSGREDKYREPTIRFIEQYVRIPMIYAYPKENDDRPKDAVISFHLFMRPSGDQRKDSIVKTELFEQNMKGKFNVVFALDDRNQVVDNWREMGISCHQVAPGNF